MDVTVLLTLSFCLGGGLFIINKLLPIRKLLSKKKAEVPPTPERVSVHHTKLLKTEEPIRMAQRSTGFPRIDEALQKDNCKYDILIPTGMSPQDVVDQAVLHAQKHNLPIIDELGNKSWKKDGVLHRENGPAIEYPSGTKEWWLNGKRHREDGPAVEYYNGTKEWWLNGELHREDGPAIEYHSGDKRYWYKGKQLPHGHRIVKDVAQILWLNAKGNLHREDGPAYINPGISEQWFLNGKWHRIGGPAISGPNGEQQYYQHGKRHREDGPAAIHVSGYKYWCYNDELHRETGPAVEGPNGEEEWWFRGTMYTKEEFNDIIGPSFFQRKSDELAEQREELIARANRKSDWLVKENSHNCNDPHYAPGDDPQQRLMTFDNDRDRAIREGKAIHFNSDQHFGHGVSERPKARAALLIG